MKKALFVIGAILIFIAAMTFAFQHLNMNNS
jgi:uncharacterized protein YxeA